MVLDWFLADVRSATYRNPVMKITGFLYFILLYQKIKIEIVIKNSIFFQLNSTQLNSTQHILLLLID